MLLSKNSPLKIYPDYILYLVLFACSLIACVSSVDLSKSGGNLRLFFFSGANKAELWVHMVRRLQARGGGSSLD